MRRKKKTDLDFESQFGPTKWMKVKFILLIAGIGLAIVFSFFFTLTLMSYFVRAITGQ